MSSVSIFMSQRREEIQTTNEITAYFTMTTCNKLFIVYLTRSTESHMNSSIQYLNYFNDGSKDYVVQYVCVVLCEMKFGIFHAR